MLLSEQLNELHASYVDAINCAVASDDLDLVESLTKAYDDDAVWMIAEREGKTHLLPLLARDSVDGRFGRLVTRLRHTLAA